MTTWPTSSALHQRASRTLPGGVSSGLRAAMRPHPLFIERGEGCRVWDADGRVYIDYVLGWGPLILGHSHPALVDAVSRQLSRGQLFGAGHRYEFEVAEQVCDAIPGMERLLWSNTGSEATQVALRLARAATGRRRFIKFQGHYHGWSDSMLLGYRPAHDGALDALGSRGQNPRALEDALILPWNDLGTVAEILSEPSHNVAAVFVEPVLCNSGVIPPTRDFLADLRALAHQHDVLVVFDEVITGFRIAYGGASERYGVEPDLVVLAKAIAGGLPLAAVGGDSNILELTTGGVVHAGTYNGNPLSLAAAAATLGELGRTDVYETFEKQAARLADGIQATLDAHDIIGSAHHVGPIVQFSPGLAETNSFTSFLSADWSWYETLTVELLRRGVFALPGGRWYLSTSHSDDEIEATLGTLDSAVTATVEKVGKPTTSPTDIL